MKLGSIPLGSSAFDAVTLGETMAAFVLDGESAYPAQTAVGAESNVAAGMAQLGCRTRWISRLGRDALGRLVHDTVAGHGVDVQVTWDSARRTGLLIKELGSDGTRVRYYRSESAACCLSVADIRNTGRARWMHVTGITPALSPEAADLVAAIAAGRTSHAGKVSFDANYRPSLWPSAAAAARVIIPLARDADLVFIGEDEAEALLGTTDTQELARGLLTRADQEFVLKRGAGPATTVNWAGEISEPALLADVVVDVTGAGDAFAAGYLAAECWGWGVRDRLRLGHLMGSRAVGSESDQGPPLSAAELHSLRVSPATIGSLCVPGSNL